MTRFAAALAALLLAAPLAHGNGRPPITTGMHFRDGDAHSLYVATTFGLLISHDDGCTFRWVCESNIGYGGIFDPLYAVASDGSIFATTFTGLRVSRDDGCSFQSLTSEIYVTGLDIGPTGEVWIATGDSSQANHILRSTDNGNSFAPRGDFPTTILWNAIKVAHSDAQRVYATGSEPGTAQGDAGPPPPTPHLEISSDGGQSWTSSPLAGVTFGGQPSVRVIAVDPRDANVVYVASEYGANPPNGDLIYRSTDGGMTLTQVVATTEPVHDIVFPDAQQVIVVTPSGSFRSMDGGAMFSPMTGTPHLQCLGVAADGTLVGCGPNWDPDFMAVTKSTDGGGSWQKVWRFVNLAGPVACPAGTPEHDKCEVEQWPTLSMQFGATGPACGSDQWSGDPAPTSSPGGCCDAGDSGTASMCAALAVFLVVRRRRRS